jgi:cytochrome c oxidase subunit 3
MTDHAHPPDAHGHGHEDPMSHVPPPSIWPLIVTAGLALIPPGVLSLIGSLKTTGWPIISDPRAGLAMIAVGSLVFIFALMSWGHQNIIEKRISHDPVKQQKDLQLFVLLFLVGELAAFGAIFGYIFTRKYYAADFGPPHAEGFHFGGPMAAIATFILLSSSVTCEFAHHAIEHGKVQLGRWLLISTIALGAIFLGFQGYEWGELVQRGFYPLAIAHGGASSFAAVFFTGTGFHGLHVAIGLTMLFMVLMRLEAGGFRAHRTFSLVAASWYWHFVDIVWVLLFITLYVLS